MSASRIPTLLAAGGLAALLAAGCLSVMLTRPAPGEPAADRITNSAFTEFDDCGSLLDYYRSHAGDIAGPTGLPGSEGLQPFATADAAAPRTGLPSAATAPEATGRTSQQASGTGTNVQVAGVDEADVAKRSGDLLLTVAGTTGQLLGQMAMHTVPSAGTPAALAGGTSTTPGTAAGGLHILRTDRGRAALLASLPTTDWVATQLLVHGKTVLLLGTAPQPATRYDGNTPLPLPGQVLRSSRTRIAQVDIADPAHPRLVRTLDVDGSLVGARLSGGTVRLAVTSPNLNPADLNPASLNPADLNPASPAGEAESRATNRRLIAESDLDTWLPQYALSEGSGSTARRSSGRLLDCAKIAAPAEFSGLSTLSLLSFDLTQGGGISSWNGAGVVATGATLYATADRTYVATAPWQDWSRRTARQVQQAATLERTWIHAFATDGSAGPRYLASGSVPGFLLNQYSLDEYHGDLRVASTVHPAWLPGNTTASAAAGATGNDAASGGTGNDAASVRPGTDAARVSVLRRTGNRLTEVGSVGGIGRGEQIQGVRFIDTIGYVVTYRKTDPLFTIDLSDPTRPRVAGEVRLLGYSAYLHPGGDGLLLGVGRAADADGRQQGLQLSLFDVTNPAAPKRLAQQELPEATTAVEADAHAFTFVDGTVLLPFTRTVLTPLPGGGLDGSGPTAPDAQALQSPMTATVDNGVVAIRVSGHRLSGPAILRPQGTPHTPTPPAGPGVALRPMTAAVLRTFVGNGTIWTVTTGGVSAHDGSTYDWLAYTPFTT